MLKGIVMIQNSNDFNLKARNSCRRSDIQEILCSAINNRDIVYQFFLHRAFFKRKLKNERFFYMS